LPIFYSAAEAVLVPSRSESFGLTALEAQACGTPVVATASSGLGHVVGDGETGFLLEDWEPRRYAEAILALLRNPALAGSLADAAVRNASRFSWDSTVAGVQRVYREVLGRGAA
jgi:D-inositol-3-phosphate glycosyltransferase